MCHINHIIIYFGGRKKTFSLDITEILGRFIDDNDEVENEAEIGNSVDVIYEEEPTNYLPTHEGSNKT